MNKSLHPAQRVGIFIDTQNLYHSARSLFKSHVNYAELMKHAIADRHLVRAFAYVIRSEGQDESKFIDALAELGIEIREKDLQVFYSGEKKADWDVGIAIDIVRMSEKLDAVVLVSGDGDFTEVLKYVRSRGLRAEVMAFKKTTSNMLLTEVDSYTDLGADPAKFLIPTSRASKVNNRVVKSAGKKK
ncbi:MAG TPA: NYN domain-containing protein [Candidatus Gracilibacteria bacterium]|nr:NYN domain-containing protein [Candidatus Gracilibacteria bacterium]